MDTIRPTGRSGQRRLIEMVRIDELRISSFSTGWHSTVLSITHLPTGLTVNEPKSRKEGIAEIERMLSERSDKPVERSLSPQPNMNESAQD